MPVIMNNYKPSLRPFSVAAILVFVIAGLGSGRAKADPSPSDEISRAVLVAGASSVAQADAKTFIQGFTAVIIRAKPSDIAKYVTAAVKLRPDLVCAITVAAIRAHRDSGTLASCDYVDPIIRAAVLAAPDAKTALARAAIEAVPAARKCVLAAAWLSEETEVAFLRSPEIDAGNINSSAIGTFNPANVGASGSGVISPERP